MKSVAYVTTTFPTLATFIESEVHRLRDQGVDVRVFTLRPVSREYQPEHAALLQVTRYIGSPLDPASWAAVVHWLLRRPHVLLGDVLRMAWASRGSLYALAGHLGYVPAAARVALEVRRGKIERVHGAWAHFPGSVAWLASRLAGCRFSLAAHAGADLYRTQAHLAEKVRAADFTVACVRGNAEMLRRLAGPGSRVEWLYHGVDLGRFDGSGRAREASPRLLAVGRLAEVKGFDDAIRALGLLRSRGLTPRLTIVGEGPQRSELERLTTLEGVREQVEFLGAKAHDALLPLYRGAWLLLAPSKVMANGRRDGIPNVVIEAMAMGVPVVGTRAAGLEEAIVPGETGALCAPGDPVSLADAVEPLLRDAQVVDRMGASARERVTASFDAARNFQRMLALFRGAPVTPVGGPSPR
jgi:glycosyltransferase involved in cell wall biosynthesis